MVQEVKILSSTEPLSLSRCIERASKELQDKRMYVEIQYKPVMEHDEYNYVVYTAMLIGRLRNEK